MVVPNNIVTSVDYKKSHTYTSANVSIERIYHDETKLTNLDSHQATLLFSTWCVNYTGMDLAMYTPMYLYEGREGVFKITPAGSNEYNSRRYVEIKQMSNEAPYRSLHDRDRPGIRCQHVSFKITLESLYREPIYIDEFDVVVGLWEHASAVHKYHPTSSFSKKTAQDAYYSDFIHKHKDEEQQLIHVYANDPSGVVEYIHGYVNGIMLTYPVGHNVLQPKCVRLCFPKGHVCTYQDLNADEIFDSVSSKTIDGQFWIFGSDPEQLRIDYAKYEKQKTVTWEYHNEKLKLKDKEWEQVLTRVKNDERDIHIRKREEFKNLFLEKTHAFDMEQKRMEHLHNLEMEDLKLQMEKLKLEKEKSSNRANKSTAFANIAKAAAAIIPIVVTVIAVVFKKN